VVIGILDAESIFLESTAGKSLSAQAPNAALNRSGRQPKSRRMAMVAKDKAWKPSALPNADIAGRSPGGARRSPNSDEMIRANCDTKSRLWTMRVTKARDTLSNVGAQDQLRHRQGAGLT